MAWDPNTVKCADASLRAAARIFHAIHLATALLWKEMTGEPLTMATHDAALATAAKADGLPVVGIGSR